jgi:hypothetical protein
MNERRSAFVTAVAWVFIALALFAWIIKRLVSQDVKSEFVAL